MTTFIDFRYARTLSSALLAGYEPEETTISFDPTKENYVALEFSLTPSPRKLLDLVTKEDRSVASLWLEADRSVCLRLTGGAMVVKTPAGSVSDCPPHLVGFRLAPHTIGLKLQGVIYETQTCPIPADRGTLVLACENTSGTVCLLGRGSGRAQRWAQLYYHRAEPDGPGVELVLDWHHLRSGIPLNGTFTAEKLIEWSHFRLQFHSYVLNPEEAQRTDFVRLFSTPGIPDMALHITPPLYTRFHPEIANIGLFVCESRSILPSIVARCNLMDALIVPTTFVANAYQNSGVHCPIHIVPHGVDVAFYHSLTKREPLPGGRGFNFLAIATHVERKNIRYLVRAFLEEFREHEDVALFLLLRPEFGTTQQNVALAFDAWEKRYFRRSAPIFLWTGYVTQDTLRTLYANAHAYVMPSTEGFGFTLLEAMASGTPVIALQYGGVLDFVNEKNGYFVPPGHAYMAKDIDSIAYIGDRFFAPAIKQLRSTMRHVFEHRVEAAEKGRQGRKDCETLYTWDRTAIEIARVIEKTLPHHCKRSLLKAAPPASPRHKRVLSWVLCVPDDAPIARILRYLRQQKTAHHDILCLFTRYARVKDILRARKNGFLFHRWDGSATNYKAIIHSIMLTPWAGIVYPEEKITGQLESLLAFLVAQPEEVCEVLVQCRNGTYEPRFIRSQIRIANPEQRVFQEVIIC